MELTWPGDPPKHRALEVFVRYTTDDGRELEARRPIHIDPANQPRAEPHAEWSRRASPAPVATTAYPNDKSPSATAKESPGSARRLPFATAEKRLADRRRIRGEAQARTARLVARPALSGPDTTASRQP